MRWMGALVSGVLLLLGGSCAKQASPAPQAAAHAAAVAAFEKTMETQDRVNRYFHHDVGPNLTPCWASLKGKGTILVEIQYLRSASRWRAGETKIRSSTMNEPVDPSALECLKRALRDTSFPVDKGDGEAKEFFINWGLPVPWPKDVKEVVARMIDTGGGGSGGCGPETAPQCWTCAYLKVIPGIPGISFCARACEGYHHCTEIEEGCKLTPIRPKCASGSTLGNAGGVVMY